MKSIASSLHSRIHAWTDAFGFKLNASKANRRRHTVTKHYFYQTFNFFERLNVKDPERSEYLCFDAYGEKIKVRSLLDLQAAFFENISQLK